MQTSYHQLGDIVQLKCQVLANPANNLQFTWQFNGTLLAGHHANGSNAVALEESHSWVEDEEGQIRGRKSSAEQRSTAHRITKLASGAGDKLRGKQQANLPPPPGRTTATHISSQQLHLITNVIRIELNKWSSFGHFSCHSSNSVGQQKEGCKWHIVPSHYQPVGAGKHLKGAEEAIADAGASPASGSAHHHRYHHRHHQQQSLGSSHHSLHSATSSSLGTLNNCQIIESSNAVVIKCLEAAAANDQREQENNGGAEDFLAQVGTDGSGQQTLQPPPMSATIDRGSSPSVFGSGSGSGSSDATVYDTAHFARGNAL